MFNLIGFATAATSDADAVAAFIVFLCLCGMGVVAYFLPTIIALMRSSKQLAAIFFTNLLLGWSGLGWVVAFIWAWMR